MTKVNQSTVSDDYAYMQMALNISRRGLGITGPNPSVGCVLVRDGHVIGRGCTAAGGRPHAETIAITRAKNAKGAAAYVTLEPCAHYGQTPPCAEALVEAGITRVVIATGDPDPRVSGGGIKILEEAGVKVDFGILKEQADFINQGFLQKFTKQRPLVTLKIASSADGKIAIREGTQTWITGPESRRRGHLYRANHDAIMIGIGTALTDNPILDCRIKGLEDRSPVRVLLDTNLRIPLDSKLCQTAGELPLWIMTSCFDERKYAALEQKGIKIFCMERDDRNFIDLKMVLKTLMNQGVNRVLSEGGGKLNASLIKASLVDRLIWFKSADSVGEKGVDALYGISTNELNRYLDLSLIGSGTTGEDQWQEFEVKN
jgi:diaminohydroxyphosphoribosylaminopyrimidine deaminase/5-amino-6-(5-phosphoribosylamino)uracil reductase